MFRILSHLCFRVRRKMPHGLVKHSNLRFCSKAHGFNNYSIARLWYQPLCEEMYTANVMTLNPQQLHSCHTANSQDYVPIRK